MPIKRLLRPFVQRQLLPLLAKTLFPAFLNTARWCWQHSALVLPPETQALLAGGQPVVFVLWHGQMYGMCHPVWQRQGWQSYHPTVVISQSLDGDFMAQMAPNIGWPNVVRGAHGRGGKAAIHGMLESLEQGRSVFVLGDGPRGPRHHLKTAFVKFVQHQQIPVIGVACATPWRWWQFNRAWDAFEVPCMFLPFRLTLTPPLTLSLDEPTELAQHRLEQHLALKD